MNDTFPARKRADFSRIRTAIPIPNLIEVQKRSYERFLQMHTAPADRETTGLQGVFKSIFPIKDFRETCSLEFVEYTIGNWECKCGELTGLENLRSECELCGQRIIAPDARGREARCPLLRQHDADQDPRVRQLRRDRRPAVQVRRRGVPGARPDLHRSAQGHDPARRLRQGSGHRGEEHPGHQGAGGLLRRDSDAHRERDLHRQRHRAGDRQPAPPISGRLLPGRHGPGERHRQGDSLPRLLGRVRDRLEGAALRPDRSQAEVPRDGVHARARSRGRLGDRRRLLQHGRGAGSPTESSTSRSGPVSSATRPGRPSPTPRRAKRSSRRTGASARRT